MRYIKEIKKTEMIKQCPKCQSGLIYTVKDIQSVSVSRLKTRIYYIMCPVCGEHTVIEV